jgi:hypothetical protein
VKYFVPEWGDLVDPGYDFQSERLTLARRPYDDDRFAHEMFAEPPYDGVLISRMSLSKKGPRHELIRRHGVRGYLRLDGRPEIELLGDCGAYGYISKHAPPFETAEIVDYYERLGFDLAVSIDHLIVTEFADQARYRYELTLRNADDFLREWHARRCSFTPVAAIQGWDPPSYAEAARSVVAMGYRFLAVGGVARSRTSTIEAVVRAVVEVVPRYVAIHVFGVSRLASLPFFLDAGVASIDSGAAFRQAWQSDKENYHTPQTAYAAIRIPEVSPKDGLLYPEIRLLSEGETDPRRKSLIVKSLHRPSTLRDLEQGALAAVRAYDRCEQSLNAALRAIQDYDRALGAREYSTNVAQRWQRYRRTLAARPWQHCRCAICREIGVEVIIFRGNNRNRRRGFHNLWVAQRRLAHLARERQSNTPSEARKKQRALAE